MRNNTPRKWFAKNCVHCGNEFTAFRSTAAYCGDSCRVKAYQSRSDRNDRRAVTKQYEGKCADCGEKQPKMYVRFDVRRGTKVLLCPKHFSALSRYLFEQRMPDPASGYAKRLNQARPPPK